MIESEVEMGIRELSDSEIDLVSGGTRIKRAYQVIKEIVTWIGAASFFDYEIWHDGFTARAHAYGRRMLEGRPNYQTNRCRAVGGC